MITNKIDLPQKIIAQMIAIFSDYPEIENVVLFGSRALGNAKPGSDIDLAFSGNNLTLQVVSRIQSHLEEETLMPYFFDCISLKTIQNKELLAHIKTYGMVIYKKGSTN